MKRALLLGGALAAIMSAVPLLAAAEESAPANGSPELLADATVSGDVDAGKLIGADVVDGTGEKVGEIDSVMVNEKGKVTAVVIDVSGWLESEKLVAVAWSDLKSDADGKIVTSITKDAATAAAGYSYKDPTLRKQVLTESGERYTVTEVPADGAETQTADAGSAIELGTPLTNADGSLNASQLIGLDVESPEADKVGDIGEVVLDEGGQVRGVVVDVGGFLGMGAHPVLLDWKDIALTDQDGKAAAIVNLSKERLEQMPAYERSKN